MQTTRTDFRIPNSTIMLGDVAKDAITGFQGIVTGHARYVTGCDQVCITAGVGTDGKPSECLWLDIGRVDLVQANPLGLQRTPAEEVPAAG